MGSEGKGNREYEKSRRKMKRKLENFGGLKWKGTRGKL